MKMSDLTVKVPGMAGPGVILALKSDVDAFKANVYPTGKERVKVPIEKTYVLLRLCTDDEVDLLQCGTLHERRAKVLDLSEAGYLPSCIDVWQFVSGYDAGADDYFSGHFRTESYSQTDYQKGWQKGRENARLGRWPDYMRDYNEVVRALDANLDPYDYRGYAAQGVPV